MNIRSKNRKEFSRSALLSALAEDLIFENQKLMEIIKSYNTIVEENFDVALKYPELWEQVGNAGVEIAKRKEGAVYELY